MGLFHQFIEVIEWQEEKSDRLVYQFPVHKNEIKMGAQLTVRESQLAIFVNEGQIADVFEPGRYELSTQNMPILTKLKSWKYGFNSPFKAEIYFVNTRQFLDQRWGTTNPIMMRDKDYGVVRLRGYGTYAYRVTDPVAFMREVFGTHRYTDTESISPQLKKQIISSLTDLIAESGIPALDLAMNYDEFEEQCKEKVSAQFNEYGLSITDLTIENLSLPPEVEAAMDKRTQMGVIGNLDNYTKFQTAESINDAVKNPSGMASIGASIGIGAQMANSISGAFNQNQNTQQPQQTTPADNNVACSNCGQAMQASSKFCPHCGTKNGPQSVPCVKCGESINKGSKFCPHCGTNQAQKNICQNCQKENEASAKFCSDCGKAL